ARRCRRPARTPGGSGGDVSPAGGTTEPSSGGGTVGATGGSEAGGSPPAGGGAPQAGAASAAGGDGGAGAAATASGGSGGVDCALVGCGLSWCGEECQSPCGCCPCLEGSVDAEGNRCAEGCWLRTAGDVHCQEPWDAGPCDAEVPVFWFDAATNRCEPRTYGGCEGNANRFDTLAFCEQDCAEIRGPGSAPLPVIYAFGDGCNGNALSADGRRIVTEFVADQPHDPPGDEPYVRVDLMAGNELCARMSDVVLNGAGVEAFVDYYEYGARGYLPVHEAEVPVAAITLDLGELSVALGVEPPDVEWR
ncbi:MAG TPA: BPTI/Kunitz domain-containing protein, partial [Polyangiaceae bacterium]|nr:BPTI/Kunitz domain-containing protein [Polyangiaceae bacterium]